MNTKIRTRKYEEMFPDEVFEEIAVNPIIYLAFGGLEAHGPHNPLGMDMLPFYGIAQEAAEKTGGIVHPPVYMSVPGHPPWNSAKLRAAEFLYPPSIMHGTEIMEAWLDETLWMFNSIGFKICVLLPGHAPNIYLSQNLCKKMNNRSGDMRIIVLNALPLIAPAGFTKEETGHGAMMESAWLEALYPGMVDLARIQPAIAKEPDTAALDKRYQWNSRKVQPYNSIAVEKGRKFVDIAVDWIVREVARLRDG